MHIHSAQLHQIERLSDVSAKFLNFPEVSAPFRSAAAAQQRAALSLTDTTTARPNKRARLRLLNHLVEGQRVDDNGRLAALGVRRHRVARLGAAREALDGLDGRRLAGRLGLALDGLVALHAVQKVLQPTSNESGQMKMRSPKRKLACLAALGGPHVLNAHVDALLLNACRRPTSVRWPQQIIRQQ